MKAINVTVAFPESLLKGVEEVARREYSNKGAVVRKAVAFFLNSMEGAKKSKASRKEGGVEG